MPARFDDVVPFSGDTVLARGALLPTEKVEGAGHIEAAGQPDALTRPPLNVPVPPAAASA